MYDGVAINIPLFRLILYVFLRSAHAARKVYARRNGCGDTILAPSFAPVDGQQMDGSNLLRLSLGRDVLRHTSHSELVQASLE